MTAASELFKLGDLLADESPEATITFREESARESRYTLVISTPGNALLRKLALLFGCPKENLPPPGDTRFEASDNWHGRGSVDLRELADEFMPTQGEFFDFDITVRELVALVSSA